MSDLFKTENESVYSRYLIDMDACPIELHTSFIHLFGMKEAVEQTKRIHEELFLKEYDAHFFGSTSSFYGVASKKELPEHWKKVEELSNGLSLWKPSLSHPIGKRLNDIFDRICFNVDFTEEVNNLLKRYGFKIRKSELNTVMNILDKNNKFFIDLQIPYCTITQNKNNLWISQI